MANDNNIDNYRTKDGKGYFSFSFYEVNNLFEIDVTYFPSEINLSNSSTCSSSARDGFTLNTEKKARDLFTARLIAGDWAEDIWSSRKKLIESSYIDVSPN